MKKNLKWLLMLAVMALPLAFCSCSSSDDNNENGGGGTPPPAIEGGVDNKYTITTSGAEYSSIELTSNGNYIVMKNNSASGAKASGSRAQNTADGKHVSFLHGNQQAAASRADVYEDFIYGTYTKKGDNEYELKDFGTLKVTAKEGENCSLDLTLANGTSKKFESKKEPTVTYSDLTNFVSGTWHPVKFRVYAKSNGITIIDITGNTAEELNKKVKDYFKDTDEDAEYVDNPKRIIITRNNTYIVVYPAIESEIDECQIARWKWIDESKGLFRYMWSDDPDESGTATVARSGDYLIATEEEVDADEGGTSIFGVEYTLARE